MSPARLLSPRCSFLILPLARACGRGFLSRRSAARTGGGVRFALPAGSTRSGRPAPPRNWTCCLPSCGCVAVSVTVPGCSWARIQMAPVPPIRAKGLSPMISAGPSSSSLIASLAKGRMAPNSSVTRRTTRVVSAPSAINCVSSGKQGEFLVDASSRHSFGDHLLALDVAVDAQVSPIVTALRPNQRQMAHSGDAERSSGRGRLPRPTCRQYRT